MNRLRLLPVFWLSICLVVSPSLPSVMAATPEAAPAKTAVAAASAAFSKNISFSILQDYPKGEGLAEVQRDFELMKELGVTTWRGSFSWIDYEPRPGSYDLRWLRSFLDLAVRQGITVRPYLAYTPTWAAKGGTDREAWNDPPKRLPDWKRFVTRIATETKGYRNIPSLEIYNEENVKQWWDGNPAEYNAVLRAAAAAVKSTTPATQVIFGGMVYPDDEWVEKACVTFGNAKSFDVLPFHAYPETWTPKNITVENYLDQGSPGFFRKYFLPLVAQKCGGQPVWINETGFATAPGKTEKDQANWWARALATFISEPAVQHVGIYQVRDRKKTEKVIGEGENYYLGITRWDRTPKLAFHLLKRLLPLLNTGSITVADAEMRVDVVAGKKGALHHHLFVRPDGSQVLFVWDRTGTPTLRMRPRPGSAVTEINLDGTTAAFGNYDGKSLNDVRLLPGTARIFHILPVN